jgi:REP element-mobilizing transposase RayT
MPQSLLKIYVHIVFSTKTRLPFLSNPDIRKQTHAFLVHALKNLDSPALIVGGAEDHVHVLIRLSRKNALSKIIGEAKRSSSKWIKAGGPSRILKKSVWVATSHRFRRNESC